MAEIQNEKKGKRSFYKKNIRIDLTPMVDLGFLLITFFVFTTTMVQPTVMNLDMPYDKTTTHDDLCASCVLTVVLDKENRIKYYEGDITHAAVKETGFFPDGIRKVIVQKKKAVKIARGTEDAFVLIIKPSDRSTFQNFVDITDEVTINGIKRYYIDEVTGSDKQLLYKALQ